MKTILFSAQKNKYFLMLLFTAILIAACSKENSFGNHNKVDLSIYIGDYNLTINHITGIHSQYDSIGNFLGFGIDTFNIDSLNIIISQHKDTDSLVVEGLISTHHLNCCTKDILAVVTDDTLRLAHEHNSITRNDYVRGSITIDNDIIHMNYRWDNSDTWSTDAFPTYGIVAGNGKRQ